MPVQFSPDAQGGSPKGRGQPPAASPEQVRKKWDALLNVINNISADGPDGSGQDPCQRPPLRAARDLVSETGAAARASGAKPRRPDWDLRHNLMYSVVNHRMQKNIRSYFDRHREAESYGLRYDEPLRTKWQLDTPEQKPPLGTLRGHYAKFNSPGGGIALPALPDSPGASGSQQVSPHSTGMSRVSSDPGLAREQGWNSRHQVIFSKDNHHYHGNMREYFERPRAVLW
jgi:hypothetical protein